MKTTSKFVALYLVLLLSFVEPVFAQMPPHDKQSIQSKLDKIHKMQEEKSNAFLSQRSQKRKKDQSQKP